MANPPAPDFFVPTGWQYAIEPLRGGLLVTDGHHNRVLRVTLDGEITGMIAFSEMGGEATAKLMERKSPACGNACRTIDWVGWIRTTDLLINSRSS